MVITKLQESLYEKESSFCDIAYIIPQPDKL